jgi:hypothetical protein
MDAATTPVLEGGMERTQVAKRNLRSTAAGALLVIGAVLVIGCMIVLGIEFRALLSTSLVDSLGAFAGVGLALLHGLQSAAFEPGVAFSLAYKFLVLFSAFGITGTGLALSRSTTSARTMQGAPLSKGGSR